MLALIPLFPFVGFLVNSTMGRRLPKSVSGGLASLAMLASFAVSAHHRLAARGHVARGQGDRADAVHLDCIRRPEHRALVPCRPSGGCDDPGDHRHRLADSHLLDRVHARRGRQRVRTLLLVPEPVRLVHARARPGRELPADVRRVGRRRPLLVPADRLLVQEEVGQRRRQEGVHRQSRGRLRVHPGDAGALREVRNPRLPGRRVGGCRDASGNRIRHPVADDVAAVHRRDREVSADSALHLVAGRHGRPDSRLGAHPRGDDGDGRRLHDRAQRGAVQPRA